MRCVHSLKELPAPSEASWERDKRGGRGRWPAPSATVSSSTGGAGESRVGTRLPCVEEPTVNVELEPCVVGITAVTLGGFT